MLLSAHVEHRLPGKIPCPSAAKALFLPISGRLTIVLGASDAPSPHSGTYIPQPADALSIGNKLRHRQPRDGSHVNHPRCAEHAAKRVTIQKTFTHLRKIDLWCFARLLHLQRLVDDGQITATDPISQKTEIPDHPEMLFRNVLDDPLQHVGLAQRFALIGLRAVIQVSKLQRRTCCVMGQARP